MENKTIDLRNKKTVKSIKSKERIASDPEVTFTIQFDDNDEMIIDLSLLGEITGKVADELDEIEKSFTKKLGLGLVATLIAMGGNPKEIKKMIKDMKK